MSVSGTVATALYILLLYYSDSVKRKVIFLYYTGDDTVKYLNMKQFRLLDHSSCPGCKGKSQYEMWGFCDELPRSLASTTNVEIALAKHQITQAKTTVMWSAQNWTILWSSLRWLLLPCFSLVYINSKVITTVISLHEILAVKICAVKYCVGQRSYKIFKFRFTLITWMITCNT